MRRSFHRRGQDEDKQRSKSAGAGIKGKLNSILAPASSSRRLSDFETQSLNIVESQELWSQFQSEARLSQISTAAGLRELLKQKHVEAQRSIPLSPDEPDESTNRRNSFTASILLRETDFLKKLELEKCHVERADEACAADSSGPSMMEQNYRQAIRGNTGGVLSLYKTMDNANSNNSFRFPLRRSVSDIAGRFVGVDEDSAEDESTICSLSSLRDIFGDQIGCSDTNRSLKSLDDIAAAAGFKVDAMSKSAPEPDIHDELVAYYTMEVPQVEGSVDEDESSSEDSSDADAEIYKKFEAVRNSVIRPGKVFDMGPDNEEEDDRRNNGCFDFPDHGSDSEDDRSNNGCFEFPLESRQKAELKRSFRSFDTKRTRSTLTTIPSCTFSESPKELSPNSNESDYWEPKQINPKPNGTEKNAMQFSQSARNVTRRHSLSNYISAATSLFSSMRFDESPPGSVKSDLLVDWPAKRSVPRRQTDPISKPAEKPVKRRATTSLLDERRPTSMETSVISSATCPTVASPPSMVSSLLVEWGDTAGSDCDTSGR